MAEHSGRFAWAVRLVRIWALLALVLLALLLVALVAWVSVEILAGTNPWAVLGGIVGLLALAAAAMWVGVALGVVSAVINAEEHARSASERLGQLESLVQALHQSNARLVDLARMSDAAKSLLFRQREIEAMNELLQEHLIRQEYAKAEALVGDIEKRFGYAEQVQSMRKEIAAARSSTTDERVDAALDRISGLIEAQEWERAGRQSNRLLQMFPDNPRIAALPGLIQEARARHKRQLLEDYGEAVRGGNIDRSIELLRELDKYLTPQEAAALEDSARGVFRAKLHNLGVQFAIRATEQRWGEAVAIGKQIVQEYPNSRMAQEVRQKMDTLRMLATGKRSA